MTVTLMTPSDSEAKQIMMQARDSDPTLNSAVTPDLLLLFISGKQLSPSVPDLPFPLHGTSPGASSLFPHLIPRMRRPILTALFAGWLHAAFACTLTTSLESFT